MKEKCVICGNKIMKKEDYFKVELYSKGKLKGTDFAHRVCWLKRNNTNEKINELIDGGLNLLKSNGQTKKEEVVII